MAEDDVTTKAFPLRIPSEMYDAIQELARKNSRSMNAEIKEILHSEVPVPFMSGVDRTPLIQRDGESKEQWVQRTMSECLGCVNGEAEILDVWVGKQLEQTKTLIDLQKKYMAKDQEGVLELLKTLKKQEDWINRVRNKQVMLTRYFTNEYLQHLEKLLAAGSTKQTV